MLNLSKFVSIILLVITGLIAGCNPFAAAKEPLLFSSVGFIR
jgi:hypothetical protein